MPKQNPTPFFWGIIICLMGAVCFSTKAIFVKLAYRDTQVEAVSLLTLRMIFSLPFFLVSAWFYSSKESNVKFTPKQWMYVAFIGCLGYYISSLLDFLGLQFVTAGMERLILFIYPTLVLLMNSLIFKHKIKPIQWLAVIITYVGLLLAFFGEADFSSSLNENFVWGSFLIFVCAFTFAAYIVGSGKMIPLVGAVKFNSYAMSFACVGVFLHFFITSEQSLSDFPALVYIYSFLMAILSTVIPSYLVVLGIKRIGADNAAIVSSVGPVSTILLAYFLLGESIFALQIFGTAMILFGVLLISRGKEVV
ncbi:MAG: DMT family transporter [Bacteroidia bacterium]|nr:DMT family transporter [Bacteroidia bacterium]